MKTKRYNLELSLDMDKKLDELSKQEGISKADLVRRALSLYAFVETQSKENKSLAIVDQKNQIETKIVFASNL